jgi:hypothetical protein
MSTDAPDLFGTDAPEDADQRLLVALDNARRGWPVFPVAGVRDGHCACPKPGCDHPGKHPLTDHGFKDASADPQQIEAWARRWPDCNWGMPTGAASGTVVVDLDPGGPESLAVLEDERGALPPTTTIATGRGRHLYFRHPGVKVGNKTGLRPGIDVKADGGYVICAEARHASGRVYHYLEGHDPYELPPADPPAWLLALLLQPEPKAEKPAAKAEKPAAKAAGSELDRATHYAAAFPPAPTGQRNQSAFSLSGHLAAFGLGEPQILTLARGWNQRNPEPLTDAELGAAIHSGLVNGTPRAPKPDRPPPAQAKGNGQHQEPPREEPPLEQQPELIRLDTVQPKAIEWLWPHRIALGKLTILSGDPGLGKSFLTLDIACRLSKGTPWPDRVDEPGVQGATILLSAEDGMEDTIRPRVDAMDGDPRQIVVLRAVRHRDPRTGGEVRLPFTLKGDLEALERALDQTPGCLQVVVDPISAYLGDTDSHVNSDVRGVLAPLAELAERRNVAILAVSHLTKGDGAKAIYRTMGSVAFVAAARMVWLVSQDKQDRNRRLLTRAKGNIGVDIGGMAFSLMAASERDIPMVAWEPGRIDTTSDEALAPDNDAGDAIEDAKTWLTEALAAGPMEAQELIRQAKQNGISKRTLDRAGSHKSGIVTHKKSPFGGPWMWQLAEATSPTSPTW